MRLSGLADAVGSIDLAPEPPIRQIGLANLGIYYFAHPFSVFNHDGTRDTGAEKVNVDHCIARTARLMELGIVVFSPLVGSYPVQNYLGHDADAQLPWYDIDDRLILSTQWSGLILAPAWELSVGCRREAALFIVLDVYTQGRVPVYYYEEIESADTTKWKDRAQEVRLLLAASALTTEVV
jgi:hypothetical protein